MNYSIMDRVEIDKVKFAKLGYYQVLIYEGEMLTVKLVNRKDYYRRLLIKRLR